MYAFTGGNDPLKRENSEKRNNEKISVHFVLL